MEKLIKGLDEFKSNYFETHWKLFEQLAHGQKPRVLFITCSDSRLDPNLITQTGVGELFVIRNAGNIIPPYGAANGGEGATLEYAIQALGIQQIVVCGHSHCGAMKGLLHLNKLQEDLPLVYDWLRHTEATRRLLKENYEGIADEELLEVAIAENVLTQIENLKTYPIVHSRLYQQKLSIYGWVYYIETGEVLAYDPDTHQYIEPQSQLEYEGDELRKGEFSYTHAPPVACDLPLRHPPLPKNKGSDRTTLVGRTTPSKAAATPTFAPNSWLSPEQVDRIFRGSQR
ncbi:MAG TPA: carbonic anhydrase [Thermosynechococcaceae cyanobacterium]|jgi:carbonic anhydrase